MDASLVASQIPCMFLLLLGTLGFGILPVYVKNALFKCECGEGNDCKPGCRAKRGKAVTAFLIYFGGGVLLGTCLLHLLPESREGFEEDSHDHHPPDNGTSVPLFADDEEDGHHEKFPLPEFIVCCGFFAVYLFEEVVHFFLGGHTHVPPENKAIRSFSISSSCSISASPRPSDAGLKASGSFSFPSPPAVPPRTPEGSDGGGGHSHGPPTTFSVTGLLTVAALSFHSLFEGFAIGLQKNAASTWMVFLAIAVHKYVIAFVVGLEVLASGGKNLHVYVYMTVFSVMSPLGMAVAMGTSYSMEDSSPKTVSVLNGIATGTLLYVTFFEILQRAEHKDVSTWIQLVATVCGFTLMCLMQLASTVA